MTRFTRVLLLGILSGATLVTFSGLGKAVDEAPPQEPRRWSDELYRLDDSEDAKFIAPPFSPGRDGFHFVRTGTKDPGQAGQYCFWWRDGRVEKKSWSSRKGTVESALRGADVDLLDVVADPGVLTLPLDGDWIIRDSPKLATVHAAAMGEISKATDGRVRIDPTKLERTVIVARGRYVFDGTPDANKRPRVELSTRGIERGISDADGTLGGMLRALAATAGMKVIDETERHEGEVAWRTGRHDRVEADDADKRDQLLQRVARQTSLSFLVERRMVDGWRLTDEKDQEGGL